MRINDLYDLLFPPKSSQESPIPHSSAYSNPSPESQCKEVYSLEMDGNNDISAQQPTTIMQIIKATIIGIPLIMALFDLIRCERMLLEASSK